MIEVYTAHTMRDAFNLAYEWYGKHIKCIKKDKKGLNAYEFTLHNGDKVLFMTYHSYKWWCKGRTYFMNGKWWHSEFELKGINNGFKG